MICYTRYIAICTTSSIPPFLLYSFSTFSFFFASSMPGVSGVAGVATRAGVSDQATSIGVEGVAVLILARASELAAVSYAVLREALRDIL